ARNRWSGGTVPPAGGARRRGRHAPDSASTGGVRRHCHRAWMREDRGSDPAIAGPPGSHIWLGYPLSATRLHLPAVLSEDRAIMKSGRSENKSAYWPEIMRFFTIGAMCGNRQSV